MKTLLRLMAMVSCIAGLNAATLQVDGDLTWNITEPRCTIELDGKIVNKGTASGTLKVILYASQRAFPSPGYVVAEQTLGALGSNYQFTDFKVKTAAKFPSVSGTYYFTLTIAEYTGTGWRNILAIPTGTKNLSVGHLTGQKKWKIPAKNVLPPIGKVTKGDSVRLVLRATGLKNEFPADLQEKTLITFNSKTKLETKLGSVKKQATYKYTYQDAKLNNQKVVCGNLVLDYSKKGQSGSKITIKFFFQGTYTGVYKSVEVGPSSSETTWGTFKFQ